MSRREDAGPPQTVRQRLAAELRDGPRSALDLSKALGVREREIPEHLGHLARSLRRSGERLRVEPSRCLACGHSFEERRRLTRPGQCPRCRSARVTRPRFEVVQA